MKTWKFFIQLNGEGESSFQTAQVPVSEKLYRDISKALKNNIRLKDAPFFEDLYRKAARKADKMESDEMSCVRIEIFDPNDFNRFRNKVIGLIVPDWEEMEEYDLEYGEEDDAIIRYSLTVQLDGYGMIIDVSQLEASGLEYETEKNSSWGDCYPDYDYVYSCILDEIG